MSHQLRQAAADYLAIRRGLGFKLQGYDRLLADFLGYLERSGASTITVQSAVAWATAPAGASAGRWSDRLGAVRGLARYLHGIDSSVEVPPVELIACRRQRRTPYLYSPSDITRLVGAAASLRPALRGATYEALFGLLSCTGMRVGEMIALDRGDVDLRAGVLEINDAKFRKHRRLPLHGSTVAALRRYAEVRDRLLPQTQGPGLLRLHPGNQAALRLRQRGVPKAGGGYRAGSPARGWPSADPRLASRLRDGQCAGLPPVRS